MIDMNERNYDYLKGMNVSESDIEIIMSNIPIKGGKIFDFKEITFDGEIKDYKLSKIIYHDNTKQSINVYLIDMDYFEAFEFQGYNVPGRNFTDVVTCIMISKKFYELGETVFYAVLGHEIAHLDFENLPKFNDHVYQTRYSIIEVYCDIKGVEMFCNRKEVEKSLSKIINTICPSNYKRNKGEAREVELRKKFLRLYVQGKINSKMIGEYINKNYLNHMNYIEQNDDKFLEVCDKFSTKCNSRDARNRLIEYKDFLLNKYFI